MKIKGTPKEILDTILTPETHGALSRSACISGQLREYQAAALFELTKKYDGQNILEIGTFVGYSASLMTQAAPNSSIITLNSAGHEIPYAKKNLKDYPNINILCKVSWEYLKEYNGPELGMIFVDGDHKRVALDLAWWDKLQVGGLMLFHDYAPHEIYVRAAVSCLRENLGREPDVLVLDNKDEGLAGYYK
jgi:predicted O-methyltransferase YrrM